MGVVPFVLRKDVRNTSNVDITSITGTDINSVGIKMYPYTTFGLWLDTSANSGTTPTLDIDFEVSEDSTDGIDGTWATHQIFTGSAATTVDASMNQITTVTGAFVSIGFPVMVSKSGYVRAAFVSGGSTPTYTIDNIHWILRNPDKA